MTKLVRAAKKKEHWFSVFPGAVPTQSKPIAEVAKAFKSLGYSSVGAAGFCWGYKVIVMSEGVGEFAAIAASHPTYGFSTTLAWNACVEWME